MRRIKTWAVRLGKILALLLALVLVAMLFWWRHALYHRLVRFPKEEAAWTALRADAQPVPKQGEWNEYRGVIHSHSHLSHDCEVPFEDILAALHRAKADFICLSDHCDAGRADFTAQWRGIHDGKLFIPGFEMKDGLMPFGVRAGVVLSNSTPPEVLAREVTANGGLLFFAHPEEPRRWDLPELSGMEIYNIHTTFKRYKPGLWRLLPELFLSQRRYPDHVFRLIFQRPDDLLRRWDELNRSRHITGIAGNDCHQNTGLRGIYTHQGKLLVEDTSPKQLGEYKLNWFTRPLVKLMFGPLTPGKKVFHLQLDPYEQMASFVNTHVLARDLSEAAVLEALSAGRAFVGFDRLADSSGFSWRATNAETTATFGETMAFSETVTLETLSPLPCRFSILKDGQLAHRAEGRICKWKPPGPGKYRVEAELKVLKDWVPWVYGNPIELR